MHVGTPYPRWRGKRSRHSRRARNPQFHVSGKRPIDTKDGMSYKRDWIRKSWMYGPIPEDQGPFSEKCNIKTHKCWNCTRKGFEWMASHKFYVSQLQVYTVSTYMRFSNVINTHLHMIYNGIVLYIYIKWYNTDIYIIFQATTQRYTGPYAWSEKYSFWSPISKSVSIVWCCQFFFETLRYNLTH